MISEQDSECHKPAACCHGVLHILQHDTYITYACTHWTIKLCPTVSNWHWPGVYNNCIVAVRTVLWHSSHYIRMYCDDALQKLTFTLHHIYIWNRRE